MNQKRIIYMGTPPFAVGPLEALVKAGCDVEAVITAPDRRAGRGLQLRPSAIKECALRLELPLLQPVDLRDPVFLEQVRLLKPELMVVVAFRKLPVALWSIPPLGTINLHASLLPDYRGAAPINWAIMNGEMKTGVTTFFIQEKIDTGDVLLQREVAIGPMDTAGELHDHLCAVGAGLLVESVRGVISGSLSPTSQATMTSIGALHAAPKLSPAVAEIDWDRSSSQVHDHIRGLSPTPGAWTKYRVNERDSGTMKILRSAPSPHTGPAVPGTTHVTVGRLLVACRNEWIEILEVRPEGRRDMSAADLLNGLRGSSITFGV